MAPSNDEFLGEAPVFIEVHGRLGDDMRSLDERRHVLHLIRDLAVPDDAVRSLDEAVLVHPRVGGQGRNETDVRAFRRLDRAETTVVGAVHVADVESSALAGQTTRSKCRKAPLVGDLGQWVRLVHELAELGGAEELLDDSAHRLGVDQVVGHQRLDFREAHPLLDRLLHADQTDPVLVLEKLSDRANAPVAEMVDVVDLALVVLEVDEVLHDPQDVLTRQRGLLQREVQPQLVVDLETPHLREVVALGVEEQVLEVREGCFVGRRVTGGGAGRSR